MQLRVLTALFVLGCVNFVSVRADVEAKEPHVVEDIADANTASDNIVQAGLDDAADPISSQKPHISEEVVAQMMELISPECRAAIQMNPEDAKGLSDECNTEVQTTLQKLMGGNVRNPNDPVTPEIFGKMMASIPADCRAEIEANPTDGSKISDPCKQTIQTTLSKLIAKAKRAEEFKKSRASAKPFEGSTEDQAKSKKQRRGKKETKGNNTTTLLFVIGFVVTALAGVVGYAYMLHQKQALQGRTSKAPKKLSKHKKEKEGRRQAAAAAASIN
ncbi:hypothetical protein H310_00623 [Aphanomyces invadans]|uniref:Uncharacterized protein n=1 Tax=Aphanomyces invadans TaxID=157072 RepID=A0A024UWD7_9STRA|nr:hypothetical protein H310_00623 [Aphanomyces invadans]ETW10280.1 hypothetical protein H310_00623 [Aphanomyces invadans]|eukprot:XP_008861691.1 hypothetical protein H310_00623 [Aphanomyces invadans]